MNVRITPSDEGDRTVLQVAGRLQAADVAELDKELDSHEGSIVLDLSQLTSADDAGIARLRELAAEGTELRGATPYVQMLLDDWKAT